MDSRKVVDIRPTDVVFIEMLGRPLHSAQFRELLLRKSEARPFFMEASSKGGHTTFPVVHE